MFPYMSHFRDILFCTVVSISLLYLHTAVKLPLAVFPDFVVDLYVNDQAELYILVLYVADVHVDDTPLT